MRGAREPRGSGAGAGPGGRCHADRAARARHSYAELALASGVRLDVVSRQLGHASIATTAANYVHDNDAAAPEAAAKMAAIMDADTR